MENNYLYRSLTQDLRSLNNLIKVVICNNDSLETRSWLDPRKTFAELDDISSFRVSDEFERTACLELIIDRLYIILNLGIKYLDKATGNTGKLQKNIGKPKKVTLGLCANILWDKIKHTKITSDIHADKMFRANELDFDQTNILTTDRQIQTCCELTGCNTCKIAQDCVQSIMEELLNQKQYEHVAEAKKNIQCNIYEITQSESMDTLASAIKIDVIAMTKENRDLQAKVEDQERMYQFLNYNYQDVLRKNEELFVKIKDLEELEAGHLENVGILQHKTNKLHHDKYHMEKILKFEKQNIENLQKELEKSTGAISDLRFDNENLQRRIKSLVSDAETINAEKELWKIRFNEAHEESKKLRAMTDNLKTMVNDLEGNLQTVTTNFAELDKRIERNFEEIDSNAKAYVDLLKKTEDVVQSNAAMNDKLNAGGRPECCSNMSSSVLSDFQVQGNPLYDMMKQVEINKSNIKKLEKQNNLLLSTIKKFRFRTTENSTI